MVHTMTDSPDPATAKSESAFAMDPVETVLTLSRFLVGAQRNMAESRRVLDNLPPAAAELPEAVEVAAKCRALEETFVRETLPSLAASMRLALEVYDTFGPGYHVIEDPVEAALLNNKHHVWTTELTKAKPDGD